MNDIGDTKYVLFNAQQPDEKDLLIRSLEKELLEARQFIGIAGHELRMPISSIQAYTQILYNESLETKDERWTFLLSRLHNQVLRLTSLSGNLLDMTRISEQQLRLKECWFDLNSLVCETVEEVQRTTRQRLRIKDNLPMPLFWADREKIGQVLINLLSNAIKYSPATEEILVSLVTTLHRKCYLSVQDFGIGIAPDLHNRIFDRFFRVGDHPAGGEAGLGLGLYISHEIVRRHGGAITIVSERGKGATFTVSLPFRSPTNGTDH